MTLALSQMFPGGASHNFGDVPLRNVEALGDNPLACCPSQGPNLLYLLRCEFSVAITAALEGFRAVRTSTVAVANVIHFGQPLQILQMIISSLSIFMIRLMINWWSPNKGEEDKTMDQPALTGATQMYSQVAALDWQWLHHSPRNCAAPSGKASDPTEAGDFIVIIPAWNGPPSLVSRNCKMSLHREFTSLFAMQPVDDNHAAASIIRRETQS